jgi:hypothetical protein
MFGFQVVCSIFAAIQAFPEMKKGDFSSAGVVIFYLLCASVIVSVVIGVRAVTGRHSVGQARPVPPTPSYLIPAVYKGVKGSTDDSQFTVKYEVKTISVTLGSRVRVPWKLGDEASLLFKEIKNDAFDKRTSPEPCVNISIQGAMNVHHGIDVRKVAHLDYIVFPVSSGRFRVDSSLWDRSADASFFSFASITLEHVNPHTGEAEFESVFISVSKR